MQTLTNPELDDIERTLGFKLPGLYRRLLVVLGFGPVGASCEIYDPRLIRELYESFFEDSSQLFALWFPFGCDRETQEVWVINVLDETAAALWHETVPDDWPDETWLPYEDWVSRYLDPIVNESS